MSYNYRLLFIFCAVIVSALTLTLNSLSVSGQSEEEQGADTGKGILMFALDTDAALSSDDASNMRTAFFTTLDVVDRNSARVLLFSEVPGDVATVETRFKFDSIRRTLDDLPAPAEASSDVLGAAAYIYSYFLENAAPKGSRAIFITPALLVDQSETTLEGMRTLASLFVDQGWVLDAVTLPSSSVESQRVMGELSTMTNGSIFHMGGSEGVSEFVQYTSGITAEAFVNMELESSSVAGIVSVAPYTDSSLIVLYKSDPTAEFTLHGPDGTAMESTGKGISISESPNLLTARLESPAPGHWVVVGRGSGLFLAHSETNNPLELQLVDSDIFPISADFSLSAAPFIEGKMQTISGAFIEARITDATGKTATYEMQDNGLDGDATAGDGIYSATVHHVDVQGVNGTLLRLRWLDYSGTVENETYFRTEHFPELSLSSFDLEEPIEVGQRFLAGVAEVTLDGRPHLVLPEELSAQFADGAKTFEGEVTPVSIVENGMAWQFNIYGTSREEGDYSLTTYLDSEHVSRVYSLSQVSDKLFTGVGTPLIPDSLYGFPTWFWGTAALMVLIILLALYMAMRRPQPFGVLYDDIGRVVVDFSSLKRPLRKRLFSPSIVTASEVEDLLLRNASFRFRRGWVEFHYNRILESTSVRVNGRPAGPVVRLEPDVSLGIGGRLLSFSEKEHSAERIQATQPPYLVVNK